MEHASDAIIMAFSVFVLVMALSISIAMFSRANYVSEAVLKSSDSTAYYQYEETPDANYRIVGLETIIPTLYKYYKENYTVLFLNKDGTPMKLYTSQTNRALWGNGTDSSKVKGTIGKYYANGKDDNPVCSFDVDEETVRHEPWTGSPKDFKAHLDAFLFGGTFYYPSGAKDDSGNPLAYKYTDGFANQKSQFKELLGEYTYNVSSTDDQTGDTRTEKQRKKRVIIYQEM